MVDDFLSNNNFDEFLKEVKNNKNHIAVILFGSCANNTQKSTSDIDICIIREKDSSVIDFENIENMANEKYDIVYLDKVMDIIKFRILTEGKILHINKLILFRSIKRKIIHAYMGNYPFYKKNMRKMLANV